MVEICAEPFIDERCVGVSDNPAEYGGGFAEFDAVGLVKIFASLLSDGTHKPEIGYILFIQGPVPVGRCHCIFYEFLIAVAGLPGQRSDYRESIRKTPEVLRHAAFGKKLFVKHRHF